MEGIMLKLSEFSQNHHPSGVKMLAKYIRRGISGIIKPVNKVMKGENLI
jgi:hypothetical protein